MKIPYYYDIAFINPVIFNVRDFTNLAKKHPHHAGIILANQKSTRISLLIASLDQILSTTDAQDWSGQVRWITG
jgi:hypothetical protein